MKFVEWGWDFVVVWIFIFVKNIYDYTIARHVLYRVHGGLSKRYLFDLGFSPNTEMVLIFL